jgi:hypothetical protein
MIFDCLNEALQQHRPYGIKGKPMPWSYNVRELAKISDIDSVISNVKREVTSWSQA